MFSAKNINARDCEVDVEDCRFCKSSPYLFSKNITVMCFSIQTPKTINFPVVANVKLIICMCPKIWAPYSLGGWSGGAIVLENFQCRASCLFGL